MERQLEGLQTLLDVPFIRRIRRNHGLEHGTIHLLSRRISNLRVVGRSDSRGFWLYGDIPTAEVREAAHDALNRMRAGEHKLAIHPNCGTNLVTMAMLSTVATFATLAGSERERFGKLSRLPVLMLGLLASSVFGQPLGMRIQKHVTTLGVPGDLMIVSIEQRSTAAGMSAHRVETTSS